MERQGGAEAAAMGVLRALRCAGHVAYLAGGCVRDALLGLEPKDYDVATDAPPQEVRRLFRRSKLVGEAFGVVLVRVGEDEVEVATFRSESGYSDKRRPDHVEFGVGEAGAERDARRRDFTINGLFGDPDDPGARPMRVIDYVGGVADLEARVIRAIGDPDARFAEDYLRMLRAARFAARLGFEVEAKTAAAIRPLAKYLGQISRERIGIEVAAMLRPPVPPGKVGEVRGRAVELMSALRLDGAVLNEDHREGRRGVATATVRGLPAEVVHGTALAGWMIDRYAGGGEDLAGAARFVAGDAPRLVDRWRGALALSNDDRDVLRQVLQLVARAAAWRDSPIAGRKRLLAEPLWPEGRRVLHAMPGGATAAAGIDGEVAELAQGGGVSPVPLVTGDDLVAAGLQPGPAFGRWLEGVYDEQLEGRVVTREQALRWVRAQATREA